MKRKACDAMKTPKSTADVEAWHFELAAQTREKTIVQLAQAEKLAQVNKGEEELIALLNERIANLKRGITEYAVANRKDLCPPGKKSVTLQNGKISWRWSPPSVQVKNTAQALISIKMQGLEKLFITTKEVLDKEAVRKNPMVAERIDGLKVGSGGEKIYIATSPNAGLKKEGGVEG